MPPLLVAGLVASAVGTAVSTVGQVKAGNAAQRAGDYNAQVATEEAQSQEATQRHTDLVTLSRSKAVAGASGVDASSGSPLDVMAESARQSEITAMNIRRGGVLDAYGQRVAGANAKTASRYGAASTILTGGASLAKQGQEAYNLNR